MDRYHTSNGLTELAVQTFKAGFKIMKEGSLVVNCQRSFLRIVIHHKVRV